MVKVHAEALAGHLLQNGSRREADRVPICFHGFDQGLDGPIIDLRSAVDRPSMEYTFPGHWLINKSSAEAT